MLCAETAPGEPVARGTFYQSRLNPGVKKKEEAVKRLRVLAARIDSDYIIYSQSQYESIQQLRAKLRAVHRLLSWSGLRVCFFNQELGKKNLDILGHFKIRI